MTTGLFFLLLAVLVLVFFAMAMWSFHASESEQRLERINQSLLLMVQCHESKMGLMNAQLMLWLSRVLGKDSPSECSGVRAASEPETGEKPEPQSNSTSEEVAVADEPCPECCDGAKVDESDSVEESA